MHNESTELLLFGVCLDKRCSLMGEWYILFVVVAQGLELASYHVEID